MYLIITIAVVIALSFFLPDFLKSQTGLGGMIRKASSLLQAGKYQEALAKAQGALDKYPDSDKQDAALFVIGLSQSKLENFDIALTVLEKVISDYPQSRYAPEAIYYIAEIYAEKGELRTTLDYLDKISKDYPDAKNSLAKARELRMRLSAEEAFQKAHALFKDKEYQEAVLEFEKLLSSYPHNFSFSDSALLEIGISQRQLEANEKSLAYFQDLISNYPQSPYIRDALFESAQLSMEKEDFKTAEEYVNRILREYPDVKDNPSMYNVASLKQAVEAGKAVSKIKSLIQDKKYSEALNEAQTALNQYPNTGWIDDILFAIGLCQSQLGNGDEAATALKKLINDHPESIYVSEANKLLNELKTTR